MDRRSLSGSCFREEFVARRLAPFATACAGSSNKGPVRFTNFPIVVGRLAILLDELAAGDQMDNTEREH